MHTGDVLLHHNLSAGIMRQYVIQDMLGQVCALACIYIIIYVYSYTVCMHRYLRVHHNLSAGVMRQCVI